MNRGQQLLLSKFKKIGATSVTMPLDYATGAAVVGFTLSNVPYSFRYKDINASAAMSKLAFSLRMLLIAHERGILTLDKTAKEYIAIEAPQGSDFSVPPEYANQGKFLHILGLPETASNQEIELAFKRAARTYHPDRAMTDEDKSFYNGKMADINNAYTELKKIRRI